MIYEYRLHKNKCVTFFPYINYNSYILYHVKWYLIKLKIENKKQCFAIATSVLEFVMQVYGAGYMPKPTSINECVILESKYLETLQERGLMPLLSNISCELMILKESRKMLEKTFALLEKTFYVLKKYCFRKILYRSPYFKVQNITHCMGSSFFL